MTESEYLVSYGRAGDFGRFRPSAPLACRRGDRVVIRGSQGLELGSVLCPATSGHAPFLSRTALGEILRLAGPDDLRAAEAQRQRGLRLFEQGRHLVQELALPLEIVDVDVLLDGDRAIIYHLRREECDFRPLVSQLSRAHDLLILMQNLAEPAELHDDHEHGCGKPGCGKTEGGTCSTCGSGGGCGTCSSGTHKDEITAYLLGRRQMLEERVRTPLL